MSDPYETLGIQRGAPLEVIKRAFRALSSKAHPDRNGGDTRQQQELNDAYALLTDPERRAQYDEFGTTSNRERNAKVRDLIITFVQRAMQLDVLEVDPLKFARDSLISEKKAAARARKTVSAHVERLKKRIKRLKRKDGNKDDFLLVAIGYQIEQPKIVLFSLENHVRCEEHGRRVSSYLLAEGVPAQRVCSHCWREQSLGPNPEPKP